MYRSRLFWVIFLRMIYCPFVTLIMLTVILQSLVSLSLCQPEDKLNWTQISQLVLLSLICSFVQLQLATPRDKRRAGFLFRAQEHITQLYLFIFRFCILTDSLKRMNLWLWTQILTIMEHYILFNFKFPFYIFLIYIFLNDRDSIPNWGSSIYKMVQIWPG